jgi:hypothetical protein
MAESNRPDFDVFAVREREGGKGKDVFTKVGVAFKRRNGEGVNILLDALPLGRRLVVTLPLPAEEERREFRGEFPRRKGYGD